MHIIMVRKKMRDGSECQKCAEAAAHLHARGLWERIDEVVWAQGGEPNSPGFVLAARLGIDRAPFFVVRDAEGERIYTSVLRLIQERFGEESSTLEQARDIDPDDIGGI